MENQTENIANQDDLIEVETIQSEITKLKLNQLTYLLLIINSLETKKEGTEYLQLDSVMMILLIPERLKENHVLVQALYSLH